jgi:hypothetical protein
VLVVLLIGWTLYGRYAENLRTKRNALESAKQQANQVAIQVNVGRKAVANLAEWQEKSLPNDPENPNSYESQQMATMAYQVWLTQTLREVGIRDGDVGKVEPVPAVRSLPAIGNPIALAVNAQVTLEEMVEFLHKFYSADILQQIRRLDLKQEPGKDGFQLTMEVEALLLPGATNSDSMPKGKINPFRLADVGEYRKSILGRDIFKQFTPPRGDPGTARTEEPVDDSRFAKFTGISQGEKGLIAWIYVMNTGNTMLVSEGEDVRVGNFRGKVVGVELRALTLEVNGQRRRVPIGTLLKDGTPVPGDNQVTKGDEQAAAG